MSELVKSVERLEPNPNIPVLASGDTVRVHSRIVEGDRERIQVVQGVIVRSHMLGVWQNFHGERVPIYASAVKFREGTEERIADFLCGAILA